MRSDGHRNWLLTIAEIYAPPILWFAGAVTILLVASTYLFKPVYTAKTTLAFDSSMRHVLSEVSLGYPSATASDYIRYEFFASHNINVMRAPELGEMLVERHALKNRSGKPLLAEYLVEPSLPKLLFNNRGIGIGVRWIADTQQFGISGFSTDPDQAILLSKEYTDLFLERDAHQFHDLLRKLGDRVRKERVINTARQSEINLQTKQLLDEYVTADPVAEAEALNDKLLALEEQIENTQLASARYQGQLDHLVAEADRMGSPVPTQRLLGANPQLLALRSLIQDLTGSLVELGLDITPEHPRYKVLEKRLADAKERLRLEAESTFSEETLKVPDLIATIQDRILVLVLDNLAGDSTLAHCKRLIKETNERLGELMVLQDRLSLLTVERAALSTELASNYQNLRKIESILENPLPGFRIVSRARIEKSDLKHYKFFPRRKRMLFLTLIGMCMLGTLAVVARELHFDAVYRRWQADGSAKGITCAELPDWSGEREKLDPGGSCISRCISPLVAALQDCQCIRVTGIDSGDGRATIVRALAGCIAAAGRSVAIVEADKASGSLSAALGGDDGVGLSDCLAAGGIIADGSLIDVGDGIEFMPAGVGEYTWSGLPGLMSKLCEKFDTVVYLDAPAGVGSPVVLKDLPEHGLVLVVRSGRYSVHDIDAALSLSERARVSDAGIVINRVPFRADFFSLPGLLGLAKYLVMAPVHFALGLVGRRGRRSASRT